MRVLIAEDEEPLRLALHDLVAGEDGMEVVGTAGGADEAIEVASATKPDVALVDVRMPGGGAEAVRGIKECSPATRTLALSAYDDQATVIQMLSAGSVGYVVKGTSPAEIIEAVSRAARGQASLSIDVISTMIEELVGDMAERERAEIILRRSEERFRGLVESAPDAVVIVDDSGTIQLVNAETERLFGYERDELIGQPIEKLLPERYHDRHVGHRDGYLAAPTTRPMGAGLDLAGKRKDGTEFPVDISLSAIETEDGRLATAHVRDITERRKTEDVRLKSEERFAALLESAPDGVVIVDESGRIVLVNEQTEELFGYSREELVGKRIEHLLPERQRHRHVSHRAHYFGDPGTRPMGVDLELAGRRRDGSEFPVDISLAAIDTDEGRLATAFVRDISERRRGEMVARQLAAIVESSDDAIIGKDLDGTILTWNFGAERMYRYSADEAVGQSVELLIPPSGVDELPGIVDQLRRGEDVEQFETKRKRKDDVVLDVVLKVSAIRDLDGEIVGTSTIARDVTRLKAQSELERERALLAHLVSAGEEERGRIAADIHDDSIQAITAAGMRLQILRRSLEDPEQLKLLDELEQTIQLSIARLRHLLFELRPPSLDTDGLSAAIELYLAETENKGEIHHELDDKLRLQPSSETRTILYRIAQEVLTNVRKHAEAKNVVVLLEERDLGYVIRISDDGKGFDVEELKPMPGHLGLSAMKERASLAGGWLQIDSAPGKGTTVEVWIPRISPDTHVGSPGSEAPSESEAA